MCSYDAYAAVLSGSRVLGHRPLALERVAARAPGRAREFAELAVCDLRNRVVPRAKIHICRECRACAVQVEPASA